jgi:hypothetical protein
MKRTFVIGLLGFSAAALLGCPVFSGGSGGNGGGSCVGDPYSSCCQDCPSGSVCDCASVDGSYDASYDSGTGDVASCTITGCPQGSVCEVVDAVPTCVPSADGPVGDAAKPFKGCTSNSQCAADGGTGSLCLDGTCVSPANQCTDGTQCHDNEECVQGACVPSCSATSPCPTGYACSFPGDSGATGVCTGNPTPCGGTDAGAACTGGTTCVDQHCVPNCAGGDAACATGLVCVDNGCIPDQKPVFVCNEDGVQGACDPGSVCLHHSCYIGCDSPDASTPDASDSCSTASTFNVCKSVTTSSGAYYVCGSNSNLGSDCDPTLVPPKNCTSPDICIDGYCR